MIKIMTKIAAFRQDPAIDKFFRKQRLKHGAFGSLMVLPIQRITRYKLLFERLLRVTPENHKEHKYVFEAYEKTKQALQYTNTLMDGSEKENSFRLPVVQSKIVDIPIPLWDTNRIYYEPDIECVKPVILIFLCECLCLTIYLF
eukprot:UN03164